LGDKKKVYRNFVFFSLASAKAVFKASEIVQSAQIIAAGSALRVERIRGRVHLVAFRLADWQLVGDAVCALETRTRRWWNQLQLVITRACAHASHFTV
jgi:hypothetical protein